MFSERGIENEPLSLRHLRNLCRNRYLQLVPALHRVKCDEKNHHIPDHRKAFCRFWQGGHASSHVTMTTFRNWLATTGGACFIDTPPRRRSSCAFTRYPLTSDSLLGFPVVRRGSSHYCT